MQGKICFCYFCALFLWINVSMVYIFYDTIQLFKDNYFYNNINGESDIKNGALVQWLQS